jgi:hypothetical protein
VLPWGTLVTGAVGLAGIAGTAWQSKRSREAQSKDLRASIDAAAGNLRLSITTEDDRANKAEKRRIYARCLAALNAGLNAALEPASKSDYTPIRVRVELANAVAEIELIGPGSIALLAGDAHLALLRFKPNAPSATDEYMTARTDLLFAMRLTLASR